MIDPISIVFSLGLISTFVSIWIAHKVNPKAEDLLMYFMLILGLTASTIVLKSLTYYPYDIYQYPIQDAILAYGSYVLWNTKKHIWAGLMIPVLLFQVGATFFFLITHHIESLLTFKVLYNCLFGMELTILLAAAVGYIFGKPSEMKEVA